MDILQLLLRGMASLPSLIQGVEAAFGEKTGDQKKEAALTVVTSALNVVDAVAQKQIVDATGFTSGLSTIIDGVVVCLNASIWHEAPIAK